MFDTIGPLAKKALLVGTVCTIAFGMMDRRADAVTLASTQLGAVGLNGGNGITPVVPVLGWRFEIADPFQVQQIGGHMKGSATQGLPPYKDIFGAIVPLASVTSLPTPGPGGTPFDPAAAIASTTFTPPGSNTAPFASQSEDFRVPLDVTLAPGAYALMFGTGMFGTTGNAAMPANADQPFIAPTTADSFIKWQQPFGSTEFQWLPPASIPFARMRFVIEGISLGPPSLTADFDSDGDVDDIDLLIWDAFYGLGNGADTDGDGDSDGTDFLTWQREHTGPGAPVSVAVPEPTSILLVGLASLGVAWPCRLRRTPELGTMNWKGI